MLVFIILFIQKRPKGLFPQKGRAAPFLTCAASLSVRRMRCQDGNASAMLATRAAAGR